MNKDFYKYLPTGYCNELDIMIKEHSSSPWFAKAWGEYRNYVRLSKGTLGIKSPGYVFNKYVDRSSK